MQYICSMASVMRFRRTILTDAFMHALSGPLPYARDAPMLPRNDNHCFF